MSSDHHRAVDHGSARTLVDVFLGQAQRFADEPLLWSKQDGSYQPVTWGAVRDAAFALAHALVEQGVRPGDRVALVSENRPEWFIADLGILMAGAVVTPCYVTNTVADHLHVLDDSGARVFIVSTPRLAPRALEAAAQARETPLVIAVEDPHLHQHTGVDVLAWSDLLARHDGRATPGPARTLEPDALAAIIYTSGTGGAPKGVMLSHRNILSNCDGAHGLLEGLRLERERFLSFLPLSHSYEHTTGLHFPIFIGAEVWFAEGIDRLATNMLEVEPTIMTAVPRLYETMRTRILRGLESQPESRRKLFHKALELGQKRYQDPRSMSLSERAWNVVLDRLVRRKVAKRFGGRLKAMVSGGGPLNVEVGLFFHALGVPVLQGYGQTESSPVISCNPPGRARMHTVGPPLRDVAVRIAPDGEILVKGDLVMTGYWNNDAATREAIDDAGWLHTGDVGLIDAHGYIQITDRKKDIIVNSGGDNIAPQKVEGLLCLEPEIAQAMVYGDKRPHLVALLVPDEEWLRIWAEKAGRGEAGLADLAGDADLRKALGGALERVNAKLGPVEKVRRFIIAPEPFTVDNDQMTPTMKVRRHVLKRAYGQTLEALYGG